MVARLPLEVAVPAAVPRQHRFPQVVVDQIALVVPYRQHRVPLAVRLGHDGDQKVRQRNAPSLRIRRFWRT